jgi:hypothetical protein
MEEIDRQRRHAAGREVLSKAGYTDEKQILSIIASPPAKNAARAQQPNNPVRPPQANLADAARNVQPRTPCRQDHAFAAIANNQAALPNMFNPPPTPNRRRDPLMEQPLQARQEPEQPINDVRAANNAAPPQNHWIRTVMFSFVLFMFFLDRVHMSFRPLANACMLHGTIWNWHGVGM